MTEKRSIEDNLCADISECGMEACPLSYCAYGCDVDSLNETPGKCRWLVGSANTSVERCLEEAQKNLEIAMQYVRAAKRKAAKDKP